MKTLLIIGLVVLTSFTYSQSNIYHTFPANDAVWRESSGGYQSENCKDYQYIITGDTLVEDFVYHKLQLSGVQYAEDNEGFCTSFIIAYFNEYIGAFREDTLNKKIYYLPSLSSTDTLLYDFDLNLGDSLPPTFTNNQAFFHNYVSLVDSTLIGSTYRRMLGISTPQSQNYTYLIEGIGSTFGLLGQIMPQFEYGSILECFIQNGMTLYPDTINPCTLVSIENNHHIQDPITEIYPNPFNFYSEISFAKTINSVTLNLYNAHGVLIFREQYTNCDRIKFIRNGIKSGIYFLRLEFDEYNIITKKIIVQD